MNRFGCKFHFVLLFHQLVFSIASPRFISFNFPELRIS